MIVHLVQDGWEVIYHRAHALLAAQLAGHWRRADSPERLYETIAAISHHDDLEREWEGDHLTEAGAPEDFTLGAVDPDEALQKLRKLADEARYRGRWVAMLVSMHLCFLNQAKRGESPEWDQFLDEQIQRQEAWRTALEIDKEEADRAYQFMRWSDRLSLILTQDKLPDAGRALEITSGIDGQRYDIREVSKGYVTVEPWPFEDDKFIVNVDVVCLNQLQFDNNDALVEALQTAPIRVQKWTFVKQ